MVGYSGSISLVSKCSQYKFLGGEIVLVTYVQQLAGGYTLTP